MGEVTPFRNAAVERVFAQYPDAVRAEMLALRELVFRTAAETPEVGALEETLKWGEPAYVTSATRSGSTVRMDWKPRHPRQLALYFNCKTDLVETFRTLFPRDFAFEGNRAIVLPAGKRIPNDSVAFCIAASLTYHLRKKTAAPARA
ncbi:DUF1801 domain-containing protein [Ramlibacter sp. HM2]|uniref:DUF1801 domain-containing protein n=2 Tax=Ramlibacter pallidus TaxID=2780087 RepID=A0ABR9S3A1_9BURK|nr:DUF1801 domain-containing protein [Ramlibacter pallidus]